MTSAQTRTAPAQPDDRDTFPMLGRIWRDWMRPYRARIGLNLGLLALFSGVNALYPEIIRRSVDALEQGETGVLSLMAPLIVLITFVKGAMLYVSNVLTNRVLTQMRLDVQVALFRHLVDADMARLQREAPAALGARLGGDVGRLAATMDRLATGMIRDFMLAVGMIGAMFWIDWELTLLVFLLAPFAVIPIVNIGRRLRRLARASSERGAANAGVVVESLGGVHVAKTYAMEPYLKARTEAAFRELRKLELKQVRAQALISPLMELLAGIAVAGVVYLIGARIAAGTNTLGDITGFITALLLVAQPIRGLGALNAAIQTGLASARRVYDLLDEPAKVVDRPGARPLKVTQGAIRFDAVDFAYGDAPALRGLTLDVPGGARVALVGRSGAGKSTLMNLIPRLYDVTGGAISIDGEDLRDVTLESLRRSVAVVGQEAILFNDTVAANIAVGRPGASRAEIETAARAAAAHDFITALPGGYGAPVGERGERLSGGQRQRIAIARAFLRDAPILLLDEATSALDAESEAAIRAALDALSKGRTTLIIAHRLSTVRDADRIAVIDEGRLAELGRHDDLVAQGGIYAGLVRLQFGEAT